MAQTTSHSLAAVPLDPERLDVYRVALQMRGALAPETHRHGREKLVRIVQMLTRLVLGFARRSRKDVQR